MRHFQAKLSKIFSGGGTAPSPDPIPHWGGKYPWPDPSPSAPQLSTPSKFFPNFCHYARLQCCYWRIWEIESSAKYATVHACTLSVYCVVYTYRKECAWSLVDVTCWMIRAPSWNHAGNVCLTPASLPGPGVRSSKIMKLLKICQLCNLTIRSNADADAVLIECVWSCFIPVLFNVLYRLRRKFEKEKQNKEQLCFSFISDFRMS